MSAARLFSVFLLICWIVPEQDVAFAADNKPAISLVRAKVTSISEVTEISSAATLEVIHVYTGADLEGRTFVDTQRLLSSHGGAARAPFEIGEEGVWALKVVKNELWTTLDPRLPFRYRSRKADNARHAEVVKLVEAIEKVEAKKGEERVTAVLKLVADQTSEICAWAVRTLGTEKSPSARKFFDDFAAKPDLKLPLAAQVEVDKELAKQKAEDWMWSKPRAALLRSWVEGKADEYHAMMVLQRLDMADQIRELANKTAVELTCVAAVNKDWPWKVRRHAIFLVGMLGGRVADDAAAFDWLFGQIRTSDDIEVRREAAIAIRSQLTLYPKRLKNVEEYVTTEKDSEVAQALKEAVQKAKEMERK